MITLLLTPFGTPFDLSVIVGVLLSIAAVLLSHRRRPATPQDNTHEPAAKVVRTKEDS